MKPKKQGLQGKRVQLISVAWMLVLALAGVAAAQDDGEPHARDLAKLSLEELMDIKVTSVSKKEENRFQAAAAIHVITQEDIRRSGATTLPDLLRQVPGMQVAQFDANTWAVSARGFNFRFASKLLVLIDGRSIYSTMFSGVNWDGHDLPFEDIERIEVIRGPGGTLWGANAVNGVINIITKHTKDTQGGFVSGGAGNEEKGFTTFRYGGKVDPEAKANYRVYGKYFDRDDQVKNTGAPGNDDFHAYRGGFRVDWQATENNSLTFTGDYYQGESDADLENQVIGLTAPFVASFNTTIELDGAHFLAKWKRQLSPTSDFALKVYYNRERRRSLFIPKILEDTFDVDFQHHVKLNDRHDLIWGVGQRLIFDSLESNFATSFSPASRLNHRFSFFIQDEITLVPDKFRLTVGSKFEENNYTGFEIQPSARVLWTPNKKHSVWAAVSRAVRTPSRSEDSIRINAAVQAGPTLLSTFGSKSFDSEDLLAVELGYRVQPRNDLFVDVATFAHFYDSLFTLEQGATFVETTPAPAHGVVPFTAENRGSGSIYGLELFTQWNVRDWWQLKSGVTWFSFDFDLDSGSTDTLLTGSESDNPDIQFQLFSRIDLPHDVEFDTALYYVDDLENLNVPDYTRLDLRLGWHPTDSIELSLVGQNLLDPEHPEFGTTVLAAGVATQVQRSVYGKVTWRFD